MWWYREAERKYLLYRLVCGIMRVEVIYVGGAKNTPGKLKTFVD